MSEKTLHKSVCEYIKYQYPNVIFNTDLSGIRMTFGQAAQIKSLRSSNGFPDIVIYKQKVTGALTMLTIDNVVYQVPTIKNALFIELKKEGEKIFKRNGEPVSEHIAEQIEMIERLNKLGYYATFCIGFDQAKSVIDWYLND